MDSKKTGKLEVKSPDLKYCSYLSNTLWNTGAQKFSRCVVEESERMWQDRQDDTEKICEWGDEYRDMKESKDVYMRDKVSLHVDKCSVVPNFCSLGE